jgi:ABC-type glycerol-3-phosphate transport system substrate-binding protein
MKWRKIIVILLIVAPFFLMSCRDEESSQPYFDDLSRLVNAGTAPDVGFMDTLRAPEFIPRKVIRPIDDNIMKVNAAEFRPGLLDYFRRDGKLYVIPHDFQTVAMAINTDVFKSVGIPIPDIDPGVDKAWTWKDLGDWCVKFKAKGIKTIGITSAMVNWLPFVFQAGGQLLDSTRMNIVIDSNEAEKGLTFYRDLATNGCASLPGLTESPVIDKYWPSMGYYDQMIQQFVDGKLAMLMVGPSPYNRIVQLYNDKKISDPPVRVVRLPKNTETSKRTTVAYVVGYGLFVNPGKGTATPPPPSNEAVQLLQFATSDAGMRIWFDPTSSPNPAPPVMFAPARISLAEQWLAAYKGRTAADQSAALTFLNSADDLGFYQPNNLTYTGTKKIDQLAADQVYQVLYNKKNVRDALKAIQALGNETMAANRVQ